MITVESAELWSQLKELLDKNIHGVSAAVAYVSDDSLVKFRKGDTLVVNASDAAIAGGQTSAKILQEAYTSGVELYSCDSLHAKAIVFDHHAYIGSANISKNSQKALNELGLITDQPMVLSGVSQFIEEIKVLSVLIDECFIERVLSIPVKDKTSNNIKGEKINIGKHSSWIISTHNASYPGEIKKVEDDSKSIFVAENEERYWFYIKRSHNKNFFDVAKIGDSVVIIERDHSSDNPQYAYRHLKIKKITMDGELKSYHFIKPDIYKVTWDKFKNMAERSGVKRLGTGRNTFRQLSDNQSLVLFELWDH